MPGHPSFWAAHRYPGNQPNAGDHGGAPLQGHRAAQQLAATAESRSPPTRRYPFTQERSMARCRGRPPCLPILSMCVVLRARIENRFIIVRCRDHPQRTVPSGARSPVTLGATSLSGQPIKRGRPRGVAPTRPSCRTTTRGDCRVAFSTVPRLSSTKRSIRCQVTRHSGRHVAIRATNQTRATTGGRPYRPIAPNNNSRRLPSRVHHQRDAFLPPKNVRGRDVGAGPRACPFSRCASSSAHASKTGSL